MGWTLTYRKPGESLKEFFSREFDFRREDGSYGKVLDCAVVNLTTAYLAYERGDAAGNREVFGIVCLLRYGPGVYDLGYKDMDEAEGPYHYNCPERILRLLTPTDNEHARRWREKCWENIRAREARRKARPKLAKGMVIEFAEPIAFRSGRKEKTLRLVNPRRLLFESLDGCHLYQLRRRTLRDADWKVVQA